MSKIWQRYFFKELIQVFCLFICCFYFLYVLIDYSVHTKDFQNGAIGIGQLIAYYGCQFTKRGDILIPIAILIATIKVLTAANMRHEIVALATGGISLKKIMAPFLGVATGCSLLLYLNFQYLQPFCLDQITAFETRFFKTSSNKGKKSLPVNALVLEDGTLLLYQQYDPHQKAFLDAYWLKNNDHLFRMQSLFPHATYPYGTQVDCLERSSEGELVKTASYEVLPFPQIEFNPYTLFSAANPPRMQSISELARTIGWKQVGFGKMHDRMAESVTFFYYKLVIPLVCLLTVIGPAPFCMRFSRNLSVFLIYAISLIGIIGYYTIMNAATILATSQVIPPIAAILLPPAACFLILGWRYAKL
jgi:lipopolysaccharide export system permease protein